MKKAYIAPSTGVYNIDCASNIMSASSVSSLSIDSSDANIVDTSVGGNQLGREDNAGSSVWDSEW